ncbi:MAG: hypothetical protein LLF76_03425 [Planctomycetaceae bacterium]|nr:hypothetical protein [Planctomycetaceae bacterium]
MKPEFENAQRILAALREFGFGSVNLQDKDLTELDRVIQLGFPPVRIDFLTSLTGLNWEQAVRGCLKGQIGGIPVSFLGKEEFILNKKTLGRKKDLADAELLEENE